MTAPSAALAAPKNTVVHDDPAPSQRLHGRGLFIARSVWLLLAAGVFANFLFGIPVYYAQLLKVCPSTSRSGCARRRNAPSIKPIVWSNMQRGLAG